MFLNVSVWGGTTVSGSKWVEIAAFYQFESRTKLRADEKKTVKWARMLLCDVDTLRLAFVSMLTRRPRPLRRRRRRRRCRHRRRQAIRSSPLNQMMTTATTTTEVKSRCSSSEPAKCSWSVAIRTRRHVSCVSVSVVKRGGGQLFSSPLRALHVPTSSSLAPFTSAVFV